MKTEFMKCLDCDEIVEVDLSKDTTRCPCCRSVECFKDLDEMEIEE
jgi:DNA-directed RNA polymerase subunit RPC12/RpoP